MRDLTKYPIKREEVFHFLRGTAILVQLDDTGIGSTGPYIMDCLQRFTQEASDEELSKVFGVR